MRPASVSVPLFDDRSNSCSPSSPSSRRTAWLTAGCVRCTLAAAREKLRSCATARKILSAARSILICEWGIHPHSPVVARLRLATVFVAFYRPINIWRVRPCPLFEQHNTALSLRNDYHFDFYGPGGYNKDILTPALFCVFDTHLLHAEQEHGLLISVPES